MYTDLCVYGMSSCSEISDCIYCVNGQVENPVGASKCRSVKGESCGSVWESVCETSHGWVKTKLGKLKILCVSVWMCVCVCWKCIYCIYTVVYAELTVSSPWWSTPTQAAKCALLSALVKSLPAPVWDFFTKKGNGSTHCSHGEGGVGAPAGGSGTKREREREEKGNARMFTSGFALWAISLDKKWGWGIILDLLVGGAGQGGDSKQKGLQKGFLLCYMKQTALRTGLLVGMCTYHWY